MLLGPTGHAVCSRKLKNIPCVHSMGIPNTVSGGIYPASGVGHADTV